MLNNERNIYRMNFIKILWIIDFMIIIFFRYSTEGKTVILILTISLTIITIIRHLNSRNEWREIAEEYHTELENKEL